MLPRQINGKKKENVASQWKVNLGESELRSPCILEKRVPFLHLFVTCALPKYLITWLTHKWKFFWTSWGWSANDKMKARHFYCPLETEPSHLRIFDVFLEKVEIYYIYIYRLLLGSIYGSNSQKKGNFRIFEQLDLFNPFFLLFFQPNAKKSWRRNWISVKRD